MTKIDDHIRNIQTNGLCRADVKELIAQYGNEVLEVNLNFIPKYRSEYYVHDIVRNLETIKKRMKESNDVLNINRVNLLMENLSTVENIKSEVSLDNYKKLSSKLIGLRGYTSNLDVVLLYDQELKHIVDNYLDSLTLDQQLQSRISNYVLDTLSRPDTLREMLDVYKRILDLDINITVDELSRILVTLEMSKLDDYKFLDELGTIETFEMIKILNKLSED